MIPMPQIALIAVSLSIVALALNLIAPGDGQAQTPPVVSSPRIPKVGDSQTIRRNGSEIITGSYLGKEGDLNCSSLKSTAGEARVCATAEGNFVRQTGSLRPGSASPHSGLLSFPLFLGKRWEHPYTYTFSNLEGGQIFSRIRQAAVTAYEKISVPAGSFDAFKIESSTSWQTSGNSGGVSTPGSRILIETYYYSPELGSVIKYDSNDFNNHTELLSYTRAK